MPKPRRDSYRSVGEALRASQERATALRLSAAEWRVLSAVWRFTVSYSRLADRVSHAQIAEAAGLSDRKAAGKALRSLAGKGVIRYEAGRGRLSNDQSNLSLVGLPEIESGVDGEPRSEPESGFDRDGIGVRSGPETGFAVPPTPEEKSRGVFPPEPGRSEDDPEFETIAEAVIETEAQWSVQAIGENVGQADRLVASALRPKLVAQIVQLLEIGWDVEAVVVEASTGWSGDVKNAGTYLLTILRRLAAMNPPGRRSEVAK